jgi:bifunctional non-homologous end joining protein LigD
VALRTDKPASSIRREVAEHGGDVANAATGGTRAAAPPAERSEVAGVRLSTPGRIYFPDLGVTKSELAQYYETMAARVVPALANRPLSLVRCPDGCTESCFYQKHATRSTPASVGRVVVTPGEAPYTMVTDLASIVSLVQIAVIEFHVWGARADQIERPDLLVFDLDPDPAVPWRRVAETAELLRNVLGELELVPFLRTTGGKGLHVVAPIVRRSSWDEVKSFTHDVALRLVREAPDQFTAQLSKSKRRGKILIDYLRNQRDATAIGSYSVRARPGAPVAMPIGWHELDASASGPPTWSVREAPERLALADPWQEFQASRRVLTRRARERVRAQ